MSEKITKNLKPCPNCGSTEVKYFYYDDEVSVFCRHCQYKIAPSRLEKFAAEEWNDMPRPLQWTAELPALMKFGYYWWKKERNVMPCVVYVTPVTSTRPLEDGEEDHPEVFFFSRSTPLDARTLGGYWAGPITEPEEKK